MMKTALALCLLLIGPGLALAAEPQMSERPFREFVLGNPNAKVTVIEYASLTCPHCANFHATTYPQLKKAYIDTGKIRFAYRDFPLDGMAMAAALISRCVDPAKGYKLVEALFTNQRTWVSAPFPLEPLHKHSEEAGIPKAEVDKCLADRDLLKSMREEQDRAEQKYEIQATPSFIIGDEGLAGEQTFDEMALVIERQLAKAEAADKAAKAAPKKK